MHEYDGLLGLTSHYHPLSYEHYWHYSNLQMEQASQKEEGAASINFSK